MSWTEERVELLRKLWLGGHSASQVAAELGGVTRNAVIGKVHRLGLSGRDLAGAMAAKRLPNLRFWRVLQTLAGKHEGATRLSRRHSCGAAKGASVTFLTHFYLNC